VTKDLSSIPILAAILNPREEPPIPFTDQIIRQEPLECGALPPPFRRKRLYPNAAAQAHDKLLCNLTLGVWNLGLPQFDWISFRVMQAAKPAVGIRLRVNLDLDSRGL
jgi:hypothetical protein